MSARIAERTWTCDCCGLENDQRGCVKGSPQCVCYHSGLKTQIHSLSPDFCITCGRCALHCTGSRFYEEPNDFDKRFRFSSNAPIQKDSKPHPFRAIGFCHCESVADSELVKEAIVDGIPERDVHVVCGKRYMPLENE